MVDNHVQAWSDNYRTGEASMPRTGRPATVDGAHAFGLKTRDPKKWTDQRIADEFYKGEVTKQAVTKAIAMHKARDGHRPPPKWQWDVLLKHAQDSLYQTLVAVYYFEQGEPLSDEERTAVKPMLDLLDGQGVVVTYHKKSGFHFTARQAEDDASYFQERSFSASGELLVG
jgi:hypothetical protein